MREEVSAYRRTVRQVTWVIETQGLSQQEHDRRVGWVDKNLLNSSQDMVEAFVYAVIKDENGNVIRFVGNGHGASPDTQEIINDLIGQGETVEDTG